MDDLEQEEKWVMVVEDNQDDEFLARRGFSLAKRSETLIVARDGVEALEILKSSGVPLLMLLDLKLPRLSGVEVLMAVKDDPRLRTIPVVVLTSSRELSDIGACYDLGCSAYVEKPVDLDTFMARFSATLNFWLNTNIPPPTAPVRGGQEILEPLTG